MFIRWSKDRVAEQHLEGDCRDIEKIELQLFAVEGPEQRLLRVHSVRAESTGKLQIFLDISKEG
jgi:hypothetical protein